MSREQRNIILIGMPGAGKSTVSVILAKTLGMQFIDTDILIQEETGRMLQEIFDEDGPGTFRRIEEEAMNRLKAGGIVVYLAISCEEMEKRLNNITTKGDHAPSKPESPGDVQSTGSVIRDICRSHHHISG
ncbi:shikimate kinase [Methanocalculus chunghsingensis]|uniref:shikimate kinase n=1 Tax=Methanocalculus chunghsingensis TaxID=156457 RepID=UPI001FE75E21|nr:shikimate kinase [Methanocalculus chunghsingensis]